MQEVVNIGAAANDHTGDPLRTAMGKVNNNFTELYGPVNVVNDTGSRDLILTDNYSYVLIDSANPATVTVPPNSSVQFPVGSSLVVIQLGAGQVSFAAGLGVTLNSVDSNLNISSQYGGGGLLKIATDTWVLSGDLS